MQTTGRARPSSSWNVATIIIWSDDSAIDQPTGVVICRGIPWWPSPEPGMRPCNSNLGLGLGPSVSFPGTLVGPLREGKGLVA